MTTDRTATRTEAPDDAAIRAAIHALVNERRSLTEGEAAAAMEEIMTGRASPAQFGAFVTALRVKGEAVDEIVGMARVMRDKAVRVDFEGALLDTCGTGGDASGSFNVSTAAAFVAAGAGARVAKHGNRAMSSRCGSADVLEALGAKIDLTAEQVAACLHQAGVAFMFAPSFHPAMRFAAGPRREIGVRTVFNILGPLTNPAGADAQVLGVPGADVAGKMAQALLRLGSRHAMVVHSDDGLDELSVCAPTFVCEVKDGALREFKVTPFELGLRRWSREDVSGGTPAENAAALRRVLSGEDEGALRDFVVLNAAAALVVYGRVDHLLDGVAVAGQSIDSGAALERLDRFVEVTQSFA